MNEPDPIGGVDQSTNEWWKPHGIVDPAMADLFDKRMQAATDVLARNLRESLDAFLEEGTNPLGTNLNDLIETTIKNRQAMMIQHLNDSMYSMYSDQSDQQAKPPTRWQMFRWKWRKRRERVRDAWLVLTGQTYIDDGDY